MTAWQDRVIELKLSGASHTAIAEAIQPEFPDLNLMQIVRKVRNELDKARLTVRRAPESATEKPQEQPKPTKENVVQNLEPTVTRENWNGCSTIRFGLMGDTQINSKYTQLTHLHALYDIYASEGIRTVYHTGDMDEGELMRQGHQYECYTQGADDHVEEIARVYPQRAGMVTHFITGNHDASIIKHCGYNIGPAIASKRDDMRYLGRDCAIVQLTPNCSLELRHPWDGTAYALSYKTQKMIDAMQGGEKPNLLAVGHYHKLEYLFYRNVHCFQTGTLQAQTPHMRGKGIAAMMGGWIIEVEVADDGTVQRVKQQLIPFYKTIKDDYKNWR